VGCGAVGCGLWAVVLPSVWVCMNVGKCGFKTKRLMLMD